MNANIITPFQPIVNGEKRATRLAFFIAEFALASKVPLIPFAQVRMHADANRSGNILLFMTFLPEGAMLARGAVLLAQHNHLAIAAAGVGYVAFAVSMSSDRGSAYI